MPISRGQMPRQMYGLGSLVKSITKGAKSAVSSVKDLIKSDTGKMLGLAALGFGIPGTQFGGLFGRAGFGGAAKGLLGFEGIGPALSGGIEKLGLGVGKDGPTLGQFAKVFTIGSLGGAALEALTASGADEEDLKNIRDVDTLKAYMRDGYMKLNPGASPMQVDRFVEGQTYEYRANGGRIGFADGMPREGIETLLPKPKPSEMMQDVDKTIQSIDNFAQLIAQSGSPSDMRGHMDLFSDFIQKNNVDAGPAFQYLKNRVKELRPGMERYIYISNEDMPVQKAMGGRIGFFKGAQADARAGKGAMSPGTRADYTPGQGTRDDNPFTGGGGGNRNNTGPASTLPTPKTNIFDKIKNNPIYQTVSPFVNPFSIGMSQLPIKAQQAIGIGGLLNRLGNVIFSPAGAAEFDMEAFQKAGAKKGLFGANDELEAMQEYYEAATGLTAPGGKFAGANNPQAVRDFITKQSEIPFGGGSYNIDMSLVPETFLETQQDFMTQKAPISFFNLGGRAGYAFGSPEENAIKASGIGGLPLNQNPAGITELDLRDSGGFIPPVGVKEKADDIPAMLSNNEFVFTADAVRGMGDGDVEKGAQRMYDMMKKLEGGGRV